MIPVTPITNISCCRLIYSVTMRFIIIIMMIVVVVAAVFCFIGSCFFFFFVCFLDKNMSHVTITIGIENSPTSITINNRLSILPFSFHYYTCCCCIGCCCCCLLLKKKKFSMSVSLIIAKLSMKYDFSRSRLLLLLLLCIIRIIIRCCLSMMMIIIFGSFSVSLIFKKITGIHISTTWEEKKIRFRRRIIIFVVVVVIIACSSSIGSSIVSSSITEKIVKQQ
mmetsp:Transcript_32278/g.47719  ORF Transcript_32278/g.47719 Transcript_32278/m.47719 type:complete len:222 (-) Transcript_32278:99-764(-)